MSWLGQVGHVAWKDLRHLWWMLLLVYLAMAAAAIPAFDLVPVVPGTEGRGMLPYEMGTFLSMAFASLFVAMAVLDDSPVRSDATWVTRPLSSSAVLAAKLLTAALFVLVVPLVVQVGALSVHDVSSGEIPGILLRSATFQALLLTGAGALAAVTPDVRSWAVVMVIAFLTQGWLVLLLRYPLQHLGSGVTLDATLRSALEVGVALGVMAYQYRMRDTRRVLRLAAAPALLLMLAAPVPAPPSASGTWGAVAPAEGGIAAPHPKDVGALVDFNGVGRPFGSLTVSVRFTFEHFEPGVRYGLRAGEGRVRLTDGTELRLEAGDGMGRLEGGLPTPGGYTLLGVREPFRRQVASVPYRLDPKDAARIANGIESLEAEVEVIAERAVPVGRLPLRRGARRAEDGAVVRVVSIPSDADVTMDVVTEEIAGPAAPFGLHDGFSFALVNPGRKEQLELIPSGGQGRSHGLVVPGVTFMTFAQPLRAVWRDRSSPPALPPGWTAGAELIAMRWIPSGVSTVTLRTDNVRIAR